VIVVTFHIIVAVTLILVVLLQVGKGQSIGAAFGGAGSSQTLFGSRGPATFLSHMTTIAAVIFMLTSLGLAYLSSHARQLSAITDQVPTSQAPLPQAPAADAPAPMPMQPVEGQK
jgi:preprotein translocase subunit SecG